MLNLRRPASVFAATVPLAVLVACGGSGTTGATGPAAKSPLPAAARASAPSSAPAERPVGATPTAAPPSATKRVSTAVQRVMIAGDSIPQDIPGLLSSTLPTTRYSVIDESKPITGLVRNDYFDWPAEAAKLPAQHPTTVIFMIGGNDNQPITTAGGTLADPATAAWESEYARRAGLVMDRLHGPDNTVQHVYWLTMPSTDRSGMNATIASMARAVHTAAESRPFVTVFDTDQLLGPLAGTAAGHGPDGIHLSIASSQRLAYDLQLRLQSDAGNPT